MAIKFDGIDARYGADASLPWLPVAPHAGLAAVKLFAVDPAHGEVVTLLRASPGVELPTHRSTSPMTIYTLQGRWRYREHDWVAGPGSVVIEPAGALHTPQILPDGTDDALLLVVADGELQLLDADHRVVAVETWRTALDRYLDYCRTHDVTPRDLAPSATGAPRCNS